MYQPFLTFVTLDLLFLPIAIFTLYSPFVVYDVEEEHFEWSTCLYGKHIDE